MRTHVQHQGSLFGGPLRSPPKDAETASHKLLAQGGFIHQLASGIFTLLPLGLRVHQRLEGIIREEMNALGAQEIIMPSLQPRSLWEETGRWTTIDPPLLTVTDRHDKELALAPTYEEVVTDLARTYLHSYKQLPVSVYQIQTKFRNEQRASGGLLRVREFVMKDLYSFHATEDDLFRFYEEMKRAYVRIFERCGLSTVPVAAESGSIGGTASHEFALIAETGEDQVALCPECGFGAKKETLGEGAETCPRCQTRLTFKACVESGHIFQLGMKYSRAMNARFMTETGTQEYFTMGCYGIGVGRLLAAIVEASHDEKGIVWPTKVAPYDIHVLSLRAEAQAADVARDLAAQGLSVLLDDREDVSAGEKFAESELIGIPVQIIVSERRQAEDVVEIRARRNLSVSRTASRTDVEALIAQVRNVS